MTTPPLTLVILAAGRSMRFGRLKQLTPIGPGGAALLDYALYDGALAGFSRFVLVIQEAKRRDFDAHLRPAVAAGLDVRFAYQDLTHPGLADAPPPGRTRPWGTGHAMLTAGEQVDGPFAVCNADDFYGRGAYAALADAMRGAVSRTAEDDGAQDAVGSPAAGTAPAPVDARPHEAARTTPTPAFIIGYPLDVTLSDSGGVSRGICEIGEAGALQRLTEGLELRRAGDRVRGRDATGRPIDVPVNAPVSMNLWGFPGQKPLRDSSGDRFHAESVRESVTGILRPLRNLFSEFIAAGPGLDREFYLSEAINDLIAAGRVRCTVLPTRETWLGVTFPGDHPRVAESLRALVDSKAYPHSLWDAIRLP